MNFFYHILKTIIIIFLKVFNRLEVFGSENIPAEGGVIVASNHVSNLDPLIIGAASTRRVLFIAKEELFTIPLLGAIIKLYSLPIRRERPLPSTLKEAIKRLKQGELIVMFPEGSRSHNGNLKEAKRGISLIASVSKSPVVPAFIKGTERALPVGTRFLRPSKITVIFGTPLQINKGEADKQFRERINRDIIKSIKKLKDDLYLYESKIS